MEALYSSRADPHVWVPAARESEYPEAATKGVRRRDTQLLVLSASEGRSLRWLGAVDKLVQIAHAPPGRGKAWEERT